MDHPNYDVIVIGAGMSGLAASIRLCMFDKKVLILEKHNVPGGLNSYYQRRNFDRPGIRQFDVGLHALTNFIKKGEKGRPFSKLLKQLRLSYDDFKLHPQTHSLISFKGESLRFTNDFEVLLEEVSQKFPHQIDGFSRLVESIRNFDELDLKQKTIMSRPILSEYLSDDLLIEMILCPLLIYGSAWEDDMDFAQFVIMFKSLYFEGFSRPEGGVRTIISLLMNKLTELGGKVTFKTGVTEILTQDDKAIGVRTESAEYFAPVILSSIGYPETVKLTSALKVSPRVGAMTFLESIFVFDRKLTQDATIIFHNDSNKYRYRPSESCFDPHSAVVCFPDNYQRQIREGEGVARVTYMANFEKWKNLSEASYKENKKIVASSALELVRSLSGSSGPKVLFEDTFTPVTIEKYTSHINGTVYGSIDKTRDGSTPIKNLFIIGTDQGFLGIVGAMLSGISMANLHGLMNET